MIYLDDSGLSEAILQCQRPIGTLTPEMIQKIQNLNLPFDPLSLHQEIKTTDNTRTEGTILEALLLAWIHKQTPITIPQRQKNSASSYRSGDFTIQNKTTLTFEFKSTSLLDEGPRASIRLYPPTQAELYGKQTLRNLFGSDTQLIKSYNYLPIQPQSQAHIILLNIKKKHYKDHGWIAITRNKLQNIKPKIEKNENYILLEINKLKNNGLHLKNLNELEKFITLTKLYTQEPNGGPHQLPKEYEFLHQIWIPLREMGTIQ